MKTYPIVARFIDRTTGIIKNAPVEAKAIKSTCGWWFLEVEHNGESVFSEHGEQTKSGLLLTASNGIMEFIV